MRAARFFTDLLVWQIADELRAVTLELTARPHIARRYKFRDQVDDAVDSICRNIAEGFKGDTHGQFAAFLRVSRRSLDELRDAYWSIEQKRLATQSELVRGQKLMARLRPPLNRLIDYLERTPNQRNRPGPSKQKPDQVFKYRVE